MDYQTYDELFERSQKLLDEAKVLAIKVDASAEDVEKSKRMFEDAKSLRARSAMLKELEALKAQSTPTAPAPQMPGQFKSLGDMLTAVYETMKPKDAAALFEAMQPEFAAGFLGRMRPEAAGAILAGMSPEAAYAASLLLAGRNAAVPRD
jgi:flagellar motility protein MotE (MotC chaperone)